MTAQTVITYVVQIRLKRAAVPQTWVDDEHHDDLPAAAAFMRSQPSHYMDLYDFRIVERRVTTVEEVMP